MLARLSQSLFLVFALKTLLVAAISRSEFYPFGSEHSDGFLSRGDEAIASISGLPQPFPFFGGLHREIYITNDGLISLSAPPATTRPQPLPMSGHLIAPFWADVDTTLTGKVWYHVTTDHDVLQMVKEQLLTAKKSICTPQYLVVVTWERVSYYRFHYNETNTFQCVLTTDGNQSFAIFLYEQGGIQWTTGDASGGTWGVLTELNGIAAVAGVNGNETQFPLVQSSGTQDIINVASTSNVDSHGVWIFQLDGDRLANCTIQQPSQDEALSVGTIIPLAVLGLILLVLILGALYGYCQVGRLLMALRAQEKIPKAEREPLKKETETEI